MNKTLLAALTLLLLAAPKTQAETETMYVPLTKNMVVNYGEPSLNRLKYLKVAVDVRVPDAESSDMVEYHLPALIDALITVFTSQDDSLVKSGEGKEEIRQAALAELQSIMKQEEGSKVIEDLLFSSFIVQR